MTHSLSSHTDLDVAVIGAGYAGSLVALKAAEIGLRAGVFDVRADYPDHFRAEKLEPDQHEALERLGFIDLVRPAESPYIDRVDVLTGKVKLKDALFKDKTTGAWMLVAQPEVEDPAAMLWSDRMSALIQELETMFDLIIFDTPPLTPVSDALPILRHSDDAILVVRWKRSQAQKVRESLDLLQQADAPLTCAVMTMTRARLLSPYNREMYSETGKA